MNTTPFDTSQSVVAAEQFNALMQTLATLVQQLGTLALNTNPQGGPAATSADTGLGAPPARSIAAMSPNGHMRIEEVAEYTGVPLNTLRYWRASGLGPKSARIGRRIAYRKADVDAWVNQQFANDTNGTREVSA